MNVQVWDEEMGATPKELLIPNLPSAEKHVDKSPKQNRKSVATFTGGLIRPGVEIAQSQNCTLDQRDPPRYLRQMKCVRIG